MNNRSLLDFIRGVLNARPYIDRVDLMPSASVDVNFFPAVIRKYILLATEEGKKLYRGLHSGLLCYSRVKETTIQVAQYEQIYNNLFLCDFLLFSH
jgi:hypothetical protein